MNAWQCDSSRPVPGLVQANVDSPQPRRGEVLIRVHAAGVTSTELLWEPTTQTKSGKNRLHAVPGHEFSGTIAAVGAQAEGQVGQEVFGTNDWYAQGATAEFCCALSSAIVPKPSRLSHVEAASIPIDALTAWQGLFDRAQLRAGERLLIHGGAGGVVSTLAGACG
jgi:NADPH:quinone reductase-like Zn-dependent oxidoreductase